MGCRIGFVLAGVGAAAPGLVALSGAPLLVSTFVAGTVAGLCMLFGIVLAQNGSAAPARIGARIGVQVGVQVGARVGTPAGWRRQYC